MSESQQKINFGHLRVAILGDSTVQAFNLCKQGSTKSPQLTVFSKENCRLKDLGKFILSHIDSNVDIILLFALLHEFIEQRASSSKSSLSNLILRKNVDIDQIISIIDHWNTKIKSVYPNLTIYWCLPYPVHFTRYNLLSNEDDANASRQFYKYACQLKVAFRSNLSGCNYLDLNKCFFHHERAAQQSFQIDGKSLLWPDNTTVNGLYPSPHLIHSIIHLLCHTLSKKIQKPPSKMMPSNLASNAFAEPEVMNIKNAPPPPKVDFTAPQMPGKNSPDSGVVIGSSSMWGRWYYESQQVNSMDTVKSMHSMEQIENTKLAQKTSTNLISSMHANMTSNAFNNDSIGAKENHSLGNLMSNAGGQLPKNYVSQNIMSDNSIQTPGNNSFSNSMQSSVKNLNNWPSSNSLVDILSMVNKGKAAGKNENAPLSKMVDGKEPEYHFFHADWQDVLVMGGFKKAEEILQDAIKALRNQPVQKGASVIVATSSEKFISHLEDLLSPLVMANQIGLNDLIPFGAPILLVDLPENLLLRLKQPKYQDTSNLKILMIIGDEFFCDTSSSMHFFELSCILRLVYLHTLPNMVNKVFVSGTCSDAMKQLADSTLQATFHRGSVTPASEPVTASTETDGLSLTELLQEEAKMAPSSSFLNNLDFAFPSSTCSMTDINQTSPTDIDYISSKTERSIRKYSRSPKQRDTSSPKQMDSRSPKRRDARSPMQRNSRSSKRRNSRSPKKRNYRSPKQRISRSPRRRNSRSPKSGNLRSPKQRMSRSPKCRNSKSPKRRNSRSPNQRISGSPKRRNSRSPKQKNVRSPKRRQIDSKSSNIIGSRTSSEPKHSKSSQQFNVTTAKRIHSKSPIKTFRQSLDMYTSGKSKKRRSMEKVIKRELEKIIKKDHSDMTDITEGAVNISALKQSQNDHTTLSKVRSTKSDIMKLKSDRSKHYSFLQNQSKPGNHNVKGLSSKNVFAVHEEQNTLKNSSPKVDSKFFDHIEGLDVQEEDILDTTENFIKTIAQIASKNQNKSKSQLDTKQKGHGIESLSTNSSVLKLKSNKVADDGSNSSFLKPKSSKISSVDSIASFLNSKPLLQALGKCSDSESALASNINKWQLTQSHSAFEPFGALVTSKPNIPVQSVKPLSLDLFKDYSVAETLNLLDNCCTAIGMMGQALCEIVKEAKSHGTAINRVLATFQNPDSKILMDLCINKLKSFIPNSDPETSSRYHKTVLWTQRLLGQAKKLQHNLEQKKSPDSLQGLDTTAIAKATLGKNTEETLHFIKNAMVYKGIQNVSREEINKVYNIVSSIHFNMACQ